MNLLLPSSLNCISGTEFINSVVGIFGKTREEIIQRTILEGNVPSHMKQFVDIQINFFDTKNTQHKLIINVLPDYLTVGNDIDSVRVPLWPTTAQLLADQLNCVLPTTKIAKIIWEHSNRIPPQPWGPPYDASMNSSERILAHNLKINATIEKLKIDNTHLLCGHKKDVVITNKLLKKPKSVAIFGWIQNNGIPIQPLFLGHASNYCDYSHGIRLISKQCILDDHVEDLTKIMQDENLSCSVSEEGAMLITKQPIFP